MVLAPLSLQPHVSRNFHLLPGSRCDFVSGPVFLLDNFGNPPAPPLARPLNQLPQLLDPTPGPSPIPITFPITSKLAEPLLLNAAPWCHRFCKANPSGVTIPKTDSKAPANALGGSVPSPGHPRPSSIPIPLLASPLTIQILLSP